MSSDNPKNCLICQSKDYRMIFSYDEPDQYEVAVGVSKQGYSRKWVQCKQCGFYYSIYSREKKIMDNIYISDYRNNNSSWRKDTPINIFKKIIALPEEESETKLRITWIKNNINNIWKHRLLEQDSPPYNVLDIGGGTGVFAYEFKDSNWKTHVIDPNKDSKFIESELHIPFIQDYYKPNSFDNKFNLISLIYSLEHFSNPITFLESLHNDLKPKSFIFIEVPDSICFRYKTKEDDIFNSCHLWMFNPTTLTLILDNCGFEVFNLNRIKTIRGHYSLMVLASQKWRINAY